MLVILPYCEKDLIQARKLLEWIKTLDCSLPNHELLLIASSKIETAYIVEVNNICSGVFSKVTSIRVAISNEGHWPKAPNDMFRAGYNWVKSQRRPYFLWLEPDCTPMVSGWLNILESAYRACGKPLMGCVHNKPFRHMNGAGIWSVNFPRFNPYILGAQHLPFDCIKPDLTLQQCRHTPLIWRSLADHDKNIPRTFPTQESLNIIPKESAIAHCCKDGSLIDRLKERTAQPIKPVEIKKPIDDWCQKSFKEQAFRFAKKTINKVRGKKDLSIGILYICVHSPSEPEVPRDFNTCHKRFVTTYLKYKPQIPHEVIVVNYNGERTKETDKIFAPLNPRHTYATGTVFDIGTYQSVGKTLDHDLVLFCGSQVHFHKDGWLERIVEAFEKYGDGIYGPMGSYERMPHLRTCCIAMPPRLIRQYPHYINSRADTYRAESGDWNLTGWVANQGKPALMVTWDDELEVTDWRKPKNIFRRGDQSNCLIWDRHTKVYAEATPEYKKELEQSAQGIHGIHNFDIICGKQKPKKTITIVAATSLAPNSHAEAIKRTDLCIPYECEKLLISPVTLYNFDGKQAPLPSPWAKNGQWTLEDMADFTLTGLHKYITTDLAIIVHWDGYATNPEQWSDEFLEYDYIGAPWPEHMRFLKRQADGKVGPHGRVGNGGFSLRSKKWLEAAAKLPKLPRGKSEDVWVSSTQLNHFLKAGCKIAPLAVAMRWSFEYPIEEFPEWKLSDSLGFHGLVKVDPKRAHLKLDQNS